MVCVNVSTNQSLTSGNKAFSDISTQVNNWFAIILLANNVCIALWVLSFIFKRLVGSLLQRRLVSVSGCWQSKWCMVNSFPFFAI